MINISTPRVLKVCSTVASQNRRVQGDRACRGPYKHSVGPRLRRAGSLYLRTSLKRPTFSTPYLFSLLGRSRNGCSGGKLEANTACFLLWFYFAPTEHCGGANCRLFFLAWQRWNKLVADYCLLLLFLCEFYFHIDAFISVMYHKGSRKLIQTFVFTLLANHQSFCAHTTAVFEWMATEPDSFNHC